jgi:saccharopine dehydrogenase (NADP+, L-glutamate forming)
MKRILVVGAGLVAGPLVKYLLERPDLSVVLADIDLERARALVAGHPRGRAEQLAIEDGSALAEKVGAADLVVSMVPYTFHPVIASVAVDLGKPVITASYVSPAMRALDARAREKGVLLLNELGLDPGIDHMEAMRVIHDVHSGGGRVTGFVSYCGGLPAPDSNTNPFGYKFSWSPRGVLLASKSPARFLEDGRVVEIPAARLFENPRLIAVPGLGEFEGYPNRDSVTYRDTYGIPEARTVLRGTLRYPGWCGTLKKIADLGLLDEAQKDWSGLRYRDLMAGLAGAAPGQDVRAAVASRLGLEAGSDLMARLDWLGLFADRPLPVAKGSALDVLTALMVERLRYEAGERDMIVLRHEFLIEKKEGRRERRGSTLIDYGIPGGDTSMSRTVGLPAAIAARLVSENRIPLTGVQVPVRPEIYVPVLAELAALGLRFEEERQSLD